MRFDYNQLKQRYDEGGRDLFVIATKELQKNGICRLTFPYANEITISHLQQLEPQMDSLLRDCGTLTLLMERLWDMFGSIPGINKNTVNNYALLYSYLHDFETDADCESIIESAVSSLFPNGEVNVDELKKELLKMGKDAFNRKSVAYFLNVLAEQKKST